jgi:hypothetical protein
MGRRSGSCPGFANTHDSRPRECATASTARCEERAARTRWTRPPKRQGRPPTARRNGARFAMDRRPDVMIFRQKNAIFHDRLRQEGFVSGIGCKLRGIKNIVAVVARTAHGPRHYVCIRRDAHAIGRRPYAPQPRPGRSSAPHRADRRQVPPAPACRPSFRAQRQCGRGAWRMS